MLKRGDRGEYVKSFQKKLKGLNFYNAVVDGIFGLKTLEAVRKLIKREEEGFES